MTATEFLDLNLTVEVKCLDCGESEEKKYGIGDMFNLEGDYILKYSEETYLCELHCKKCSRYIFIDLKRLYLPQAIRNFYDGFKNIKREEEKENKKN